MLRGWTGSRQSTFTGGLRAVSTVTGGLRVESTVTCGLRAESTVTGGLRAVSSCYWWTESRGSSVTGGLTVQRVLSVLSLMD